MAKSMIVSRLTQLSVGFALCAGLAAPVTAAVMEYGDEDVLSNTGIYGGDPKAGATLQGLAPDVVTFAPLITGHVFPFLPAGDFPGTDQIYAGSAQSGAHDGYANSPTRLNGPQVFTLDYSALVPAGHIVTTFTLGIAADDFQFPAFLQPFVATLNGGTAVVLSNTLNSVNLGGPVVQFFTIGLDPLLDNLFHTLILSIDQLGDGGDGWAVDFLTIGVTTQAAGAPEPASLALLGLGLAVFGAMRLRRG